MIGGREGQEEVEHQSSRMGHDGPHRGCMWGLLHLLDFHQRFHMRKLLAYTRHGDGKHAGRIKFPEPKSSVPNSPDEEHDCPGRDLVEHKVSATKRGAGKAHMRILIPKRRTRKQDHKRQISPLASRLLRTSSIHHMECDDHVPPDRIPSDTETSTVGSNSHASGSPPVHDVSVLGKRCEVCGTLNTLNLMDLNQLDELIGNHLLRNQQLLREKLNEATDSLLEQKTTEEQGDSNIAVDQSKFYSDMMRLFKENKELFLKVLQEPSFGIANYLQNQPASSSEVTLTKNSKDGPICRISQKKNGSEPESFINREEKPRAENSPSDPDTNGAQAVEPVSDPQASISDSSTGTNSELLPCSPSQLKYQQHDGPILNRFKDIKHRIKDLIKENRKQKYRISMDGILHKIPYGHTLSMGVKKDEPGVSEGSERHPSRNKYTNKYIRKSCSFSEFLDKYSHLLDNSSRKESTKLPGRLTPRRIFSLPELESHFLSEDEQGETPTAPLLEMKPTTSLQDGAVMIETQDFDEAGVILVHKDESLESDFHLEHAADMNVSTPVHGDSQQKEYLIHEQERCETCVTSVEQEAGHGGDSRDSVTKPSRFSTIDSYIQEDPVNPTKHSVPGGSEFEPRLSLEASDAEENIKPDLGKIQSSVRVADISAFHIQVDQKDEAEFNLVREMLLKSRFSNGELHGEWYQPYQLADTLLLQESEGSSHEFDCIDDELEISHDHHLLFDLINEVLLEIYDTPHAYCPWPSPYNFRIRPMPVGHDLVEEVWACIKWHLNSQALYEPTIESLVARDFAKSDGWMNNQSDTEYMGLELEAMILDDVLDEVILQLCSGSSQLVYS